jgi:hypothetical protein
MNIIAPETNLNPMTTPEMPDAMAIIPHTVREFGVEARKEGRAWEAAFNGPIQSWTDPNTEQTTYGVTVRLSRLKDPITRELFSTNILFYLRQQEMHGIHNVYEMARQFPFTRIRGPRTPVPVCPARTGRLWYDANPEGVIMEDVRLSPVTLPQGGQGFFVTGQGYRGKVMLPSGKFIHDVGVYGGYLDPMKRPAQLELQHLFGGIEFASLADDRLLTELGEGIWVKGIADSESGSPNVESYKNSVKLPSLSGSGTLIGARSMSQTKQIAYFESQSVDGLSGFRLGGVIDGLHRALGLQIWDRVHRVGLGSNFVECPELGGFIGLIHVVLEKNNPDFPETLDPAHPGIEEQYEGWVVWLTLDDKGVPSIKACVRAITPDDVPAVYQGRGELFDTKRVAFPISLYRTGDALQVGYGWGDRALFQAEFDYNTVIDQLFRRSLS